MIACDQESLQIRQGKIGTVGKVQDKSFTSSQACLVNCETLIQAQIAKGYQEIDLTNISALAQLSAAACQSILTSSYLPEPFWLHAVQYPDHDLQAAVADHPQVPTAALAILAQGSYVDVAQLATLHITWSTQASEDRQAVILVQLRALNLAPKQKAVLELAALGAIPEILLSTLNLDLRLAIAKQTETTPSLLTQLAQDFHETVRKAVASHAHTPAEVLVHLTGDRSVEVRLSLAKNPNAPAAALSQLADDVYEKVRKAVLKHPQIPGEALFRLRKLITYNAESILAKAAQDPTMPPEILAQMSEENHWWIRQSVAENPNTSLEILSKLTGRQKALLLGKEEFSF